MVSESRAKVGKFYKFTKKTQENLTNTRKLVYTTKELNQKGSKMTHNKKIKNGGYFLVNPNTPKEHLMSCEFGGFDVRVSYNGRTLTNRKLKEDENGRFFVMDKTKYYVEEVA